MKHFLTVIASALLLSTVGCKSVPSDSTMYTTSYAIGVSAGLVANQTKIDDATRATVIEITEIVATVVPATNETFEAAWTPIARAHTQKLIDEGKIDANQGALILGAFSVAAKGIDYVFVRYPKARQYEGLVSAAVDGFTDGFLTVFKPANKLFSASVDKVAYDVDAYMWLQKNTK